MKFGLREEKKLWKKGYKWVAGLDECGMGPLAGPVVAAAVAVKEKPKFKNREDGLSFKRLLKEVEDSKRLSPKKREELYFLLISHPAVKWGVARVSEKLIDRMNIKNAAELAMERAVKKMKARPDFLVIDGRHLKNGRLKAVCHEMMVKADSKVFSCAAASILAKVSRDRMMERYHKKYPCFGFSRHKGYPTAFHLKMLKKYGPSPIHRKSFAPVAEFSG